MLFYIKPDGYEIFKILKKSFKNSDAICFSDKIPTRKIDEYKIVLSEKQTTANSSRIPLVGIPLTKAAGFT